MENHQTIDEIGFSGKYHGTLWYGDSYPTVQRNSEMTFHMIISEENNWFVGTAHDIAGVGISPDEARVEGIINGIHIEFNKVYKRRHYSDELGNTIFENEEGFPIYYVGTFNEDSGYFEGTWTYRGRIRFLWIFYKPINMGSGTFQLRKITDQEY